MILKSFFKLNNQRGEIAATLTVIGVIMLLVGAVVGSSALKNGTLFQTRSKADIAPIDQLAEYKSALSQNLWEVANCIQINKSDTHDTVTNAFEPNGVWTKDEVIKVLNRYGFDASKVTIECARAKQSIQTMGGTINGPGVSNKTGKLETGSLFWLINGTIPLQATCGNIPPSWTITVKKKITGISLTEEDYTRYLNILADTANQGANAMRVAVKITLPQNWGGSTLTLQEFKLTTVDLQQQFVTGTSNEFNYVPGAKYWVEETFVPAPFTLDTTPHYFYPYNPAPGQPRRLDMEVAMENPVPTPTSTLPSDTPTPTIPGVTTVPNTPTPTTQAPVACVSGPIDITVTYDPKLAPDTVVVKVDQYLSDVKQQSYSRTYSRLGQDGNAFSTGSFHALFGNLPILSSSNTPYKYIVSTTILPESSINPIIAQPVNCGNGTAQANVCVVQINQINQTTCNAVVQFNAVAPTPTPPTTVQLDWFLIPRDNDKSCPWGDPNRPSTQLACYLSWSTADMCSNQPNPAKPANPAVGGTVPNRWSCSGGVQVQNLNSQLTISNPSNSGKTITAYCGAHTCNSSACQLGGDGGPGSVPYCSQCVGGPKRLSDKNYTLPPGCSATCSDNGINGDPSVILSGNCTPATPTPTATPTVTPSPTPLLTNFQLDWIKRDGNGWTGVCNYAYTANPSVCTQTANFTPATPNHGCDVSGYSTINKPTSPLFNPETGTIIFSLTNNTGSAQTMRCARYNCPLPNNLSTQCQTVVKDGVINPICQFGAGVDEGPNYATSADDDIIQAGEYRECVMNINNLTARPRTRTYDVNGLGGIDVNDLISIYSSSTATKSCDLNFDGKCDALDSSLLLEILK